MLHFFFQARLQKKMDFFVRKFSIFPNPDNANVKMCLYVLFYIITICEKHRQKQENKQNNTN